MIHLAQVAKRLQAAYPEASAGWWPVDSQYHETNGTDPRFEVMVGAVLTQNTTWTNVETALANLKERRLLEAKRLARADVAVVRAAIRPVGYFNQKAAYLHALAARVAYKYEGRIDKLFDQSTAALRQELLSLRGIGPETADDILVFAARRASFVVDAYTRRLMQRLGVARGDEPYDEIQGRWNRELGRDAVRHGRVHAAIVEHAKQRCTAKLPKCPGCPLESDCKKVGVDAAAYEAALGP